MSRDPLEHIEKVTRGANEYMGRKTEGVLRRYPLLFTSLTVFGVVSVLYGFESAIDRIPFLAERPLMVFFMGVIILVFTGGLYKRLDRFVG